MPAGRKPKPTALKVVTGNPGKRPLNKREPKPAEGAPKAPSYLDATAKYAWRELVEALKPTKMLTQADKKAMELLCSTYSEFRACYHVIKKNGATYETTTQTGSTIYRPRPEVAIKNQAEQRLKSLIVEFGLTPSSRSRLEAPNQKDANPWEDF